MIYRNLMFLLFLIASPLFSATITAASTIQIGDAILLSDLIDGTSLQVEDLLFTDFTYEATGNMPNADRVNVIPILQHHMGSLNYGIRFQGGFIDLFAGGYSDALITYTVTGVPPNSLITGMHLAGNPSIIPGPPGFQGFAGVRETFLPNFNYLENLLFAEFFGLRLTDSILLDFEDYQTTLNVQTDILLEAGNGIAATLSFLDQTFSIVVPEAGTSLLPIGCVGLMIMRRRLPS